MALPAVSFENHIVRYGAVVISLLLHGVLFASYGGAPAGVKQPVESVTRLSFLAPAPTPAVVPEVIPEKPPEKKKVKPLPEPVKKVVKKKRVLKKVVKPVDEVVQEQVSEPEPVLMATPAVATAAAVTPQIDQGLIRRERERYLTEVMAHIEQHKWYPKAARRRGIEGEVHVSFKLLPDGSTHQLVVEDGPDILLAAARKAVEKAMPMPLPPATIACPLECEFRMRFNLNAS